MDTSRFTITDGVASLDTKHGTLLIDVDDLSVMRLGGLDVRSGYARLRTYGKPRQHIGQVSRLIMAPLSGFEVDHINHNTLDNRRCNLRICTRSENSRNGRKQSQSKGRYKGVFYHSHGTYSGQRGGKGRWRAYTRVMGKRIWLGYHKTEEDAARAYNKYAVKAFGEFACLNEVS